MFGGFVYDNNVLCKLDAAIGPLDNDLTLREAVSPNRNPRAFIGGFPPSNRAIFTLVDNLTNPTKIEIIEARMVEDPSGGVINVSSVTRGREGTDAQSWPVGTHVFQSITRGMIQSDPTILGEVWARTVTTRPSVGGLITSESGVFDQLQVDRLRFNQDNPPAASNDTGKKGEVRVSVDYIYVCVGANNWKRVALSAF